MDPIQAANIILGLWQLLQGGAGQEPTEQRDTGISTAEAAAARVAVQHEYPKVQERMDHLVLVVRAMWTVLAEKANLTEADLLKKIQELDASDGQVDGLVGLKAPFKCSCGAMVSRRLNRCLFCGKVYTPETSFDAL